ncbi:hypothetical protein Tco_0843325, partial [Tanacetum coccineum]
EEGGKKKKAPPAGKSKQPAPGKQSKHVKEKTSKPTPSKKIRKGKVMKVRKGKRSDHLVDEEDPKKKSTTDQYIFHRRTPITQDASTGPSAQPQDDTSMNVVHDTPSHADAETGADTEKSNSEADTKILNVGKEQGKDVSNMVALEKRTVELDEGRAGSDPGKTLESRPPLEKDQAGSNPGQSHVVQAGPNPKHMHEDLCATVYPQVHESLKITTEEHVHIENPPSSSGTLSSMKNLDDAFTFGDQFLNDKSAKDKLGKTNMETKVESMVTVLIHQAFSSVPPLSTPIVDFTPPKPIYVNFKKKNKLQDNTTQVFSSRVYTLENNDLYSKIDKYVNKVVKEAIHNALQAPLHKRFRDLSEFKMKEILHDRMFESGSYISHPEHTALYDTLELSMVHENREEFKEATTKSCKRRRDDQDPPLPPLKDSDQSKKIKHDSNASASK